MAILLRTEIKRKGCNGAFMALVSLSSKPTGGPQTTPLSPVFSLLLGGRQLHWGLGPPHNFNTVVNAPMTVEDNEMCVFVTIRYTLPGIKLHQSVLELQTSLWEGECI